MNDVQVIPEHSYTNLSSWLSYSRKNAIKEKGSHGHSDSLFFDHLRTATRINHSRRQAEQEIKNVTNPKNTSATSTRFPH